MHPETRLMVILGIIYLLLITGRTVIIPILPPYGRSLGASETLIGAVIGGFALGRVVFDLPMGAMIREHRLRRAMLISLVIIIVAALIASTTTSLILLFLARLLEGAGTSLFFVAGLTLIAKITRPERRGRLMSITSSMLEVGAMLGPALGGLTAELYGLVVPFYLYVLLTAAGIPLILSSLHDPEGGEEAEARTSLRILKDLLLNRELVTVNMATFALFLGRFGVLYTGIPLLAYDNFGVSKVALGGMLTMTTLASFAPLYPVGRLSDRYGRKLFMLSALSSSALVIFLLARVADAESLAFALILYGVTNGLVGPTPAWFMDLTPSNMRGGAMGMYRFFNDLGQTLGPILVGGLIELTRGRVIGPLPFDVVGLILLFMMLVISRARDPVAEMRRSKHL